MSGDLFGYEPPKREAKAGEVVLQLVYHHETHSAWLLGLDRSRDDALWIPKSRCVRGEGRDESLWTLTRADAEERGWL